MSNREPEPFYPNLGVNCPAGSAVSWAGTGISRAFMLAAIARQRKKAQPVPSEAETILSNLKTGRNDPCPCGSGKKFKKCCIHKETKRKSR